MAALNEALDAFRPQFEGGRAVEPIGRFEAVVEAFLARSMGEKQVDAVLRALRERGRLEAEAMRGAEASDWGGDSGRDRPLLQPRLREALQRLAEWYAGRVEAGRAPDEASTEALREELRAIRGVGAGTADAVLLRAFARPTYPLDRGTYRILARHGWVDPSAEYDDARAVVEAALGSDSAAVLERASAWFEGIAAEYCRVARPKCDRCPLNPWLPSGGPYGEEG